MSCVCTTHTHTDYRRTQRCVCDTCVFKINTFNNVKHLLHVTSNIQHLRSNMLHVTWYLYVHTDSPNCYCYLLYKLYTCSLVMTCQRQFRYPGYHHHRIPLYLCTTIFTLFVRCEIERNNNRPVVVLYVYIPASSSIDQAECRA